MSKHLTTPLTVECLSKICCILHVDDDVEAEQPAGWVQLAEKESTEDEDFPVIDYEEGKLLEQNFSLRALLYKSDVLCRKKYSTAARDMST